MQYGELVALGSMQALLGRRAESTASFRKAELLQDHVTALLWHPGIQFLATLKTHPPSESAAPAANSRYRGSLLMTAHLAASSPSLSAAALQHCTSIILGPLICLHVPSPVCQIPAAEYHIHPLH